MHNFTHNDFIKHYYSESSAEESLCIKALLKDDLEFKKLYEEVVLSFSVLIDVKCSASDKTISKILAYANKETSQIHFN